MKSVLVTGSSTGFGREIAQHFVDRGWRVWATMRDPAASTFQASDALRVLSLDVTDPGSIAAAVSEAGPVDVLVNNAGIGWFNALEATPIETAREIFETNVFGPLAMMQAVLPGMRERRSGTIVNIGSSATYQPVPMLSVYRASKAAITAMTEGVGAELAEFGIDVRVVVPGLSPTTNFAATTQGRVELGGWFPPPYASFAQQTLAAMQAEAPSVLTSPADVAEATFRAATDPDCPTVLPAGADAIAWSKSR